MIILLQNLGTYEGAPKLTYEFAKGLIDNDTDVYAILHSEVEHREKWEKLLPKDRLFFVPTLIKSNKPLSTAIRFYGARKRIKKALCNINFDYAIRTMVCNHDLRMGRVLKCKRTINICHDPIAHSGVSVRSAEKNKKMIDQCDIIMVLTESFIPVVMREYGRKREEIIFARHGLLPYSDEIRIPIPKYDKDMPFNFLFFGRITEYKGVDILIESFNRLNQAYNNVKLTIAGRGNLNDYENTIHDNKNIELHNLYIADQDVQKYFSTPNTVLVVPYKDATQSGVITIAYEFYIPVIATDTGGIKEQLFDGECGCLIKPNSIEELYKVMEEFVVNPSIYDLQVKVMTEYREKLEWNTICKDFLAELT